MTTVINLENLSANKYKSLYVSLQYFFCTELHPAQIRWYDSSAWSALLVISSPIKNLPRGAEVLSIILLSETIPVMRRNIFLSQHTKLCSTAAQKHHGSSCIIRVKSVQIVVETTRPWNPLNVATTIMHRKRYFNPCFLSSCWFNASLDGFNTNLKYFYMCCHAVLEPRYSRLGVLFYRDSFLSLQLCHINQRLFAAFVL